MATRKPGIDQDLIRDLANILNETDLTEIEVQQDDLRIRVSRQGLTQMVHAPTAPQQASFSSPPLSAPVETAKPSPNANAVTAPMVGTAFLSPGPGVRPFVEVGQAVTEGQTLLIIEAMKTMNQIPSPRSGMVTEILLIDGQPVEYGEPMIVIA